MSLAKGDSSLRNGQDLIKENAIPSYAYRCRKCEHSFEDFRPITQDGPGECPECHEQEEFGLDFTKSRVTGLVYGSPTTFGQQAELNAKLLGKEQISHLADEQANRVREYTGPLPPGASLSKTKAATPPWRDGSFGVAPLEKPLDIAKVPDIQKYIATGEA